MATNDNIVKARLGLIDIGEVIEFALADPRPSKKKLIGVCLEVLAYTTKVLSTYLTQDK